MILGEIKEDDFQTHLIKLSEVGSIFHTKEYAIGDFYKEKLKSVQNLYGEREVDYLSYESGIIVLKAK